MRTCAQREMRQNEACGLAVSGADTCLTSCQCLAVAAISLKNLPGDKCSRDATGTISLRGSRHETPAHFCVSAVACAVHCFRARGFDPAGEGLAHQGEPHGTERLALC